MLHLIVPVKNDPDQQKHNRKGNDSIELQLVLKLYLVFFNLLLSQLFTKRDILYCPDFSLLNKLSFWAIRNSKYFNALSLFLFSR